MEDLTNLESWKDKGGWRTGLKGDEKVNVVREKYSSSQKDEYQR